MSIFKLKENKTFISNSVAKPYIIQTTEGVKIDLQPDLNLFIDLPDHTIRVKDKIVKSSILPTVGLTGILLKNIVNGQNATLSDTLLDIVTPLLKENVNHFLFFLESECSDSDAILVEPLFDKHLDPVELPENLSSYVCTNHLPITSEKDYYVYNFDHDTSKKSFSISLFRIEDVEKDIYPIVTNKSSVLWKDKWDQRATIFLRTYNIGLVLPRNYGKEDCKNVDDILNHVDHLITKLNINQDYDKEYNEMLSAKLPGKGVSFMMDTPFADHKLVTILNKINVLREEIKPALLNALSQCLGYMVAQKIHCCSQCRFMDAETL